MPFEERLRQARSLLEKKLLVVSELTRRLKPKGITPIVVGGSAVEIYSAGDYMSADIDLVVASRQQAVAELQQMGFRAEGRVFYHPAWDITLEIPDETLAGDAERITEIQIDDGVVYLDWAGRFDSGPSERLRLRAFGRGWALGTGAAAGVCRGDR